MSKTFPIFVYVFVCKIRDYLKEIKQGNIDTNRILSIILEFNAYFTLSIPMIILMAFAYRESLDLITGDMGLMGAMFGVFTWAGVTSKYASDYFSKKSRRTDE